MIGVVDYGVGNITAFLNLLKRLGHEAVAVRSVDQFHLVHRLILPGVGSFDHAMIGLNRSGLRSELERVVSEDARPVLGVCVGMQMLGDESEEGKEAGLGWIPGKVARLTGPQGTQKLRLPHMGWNDVEPVSSDCVFQGSHKPRFYFLHSYAFVPDDSRHVLAHSQYGDEIVAAVRRGHVWGTQFHPEKSHGWGADLLNNFARGVGDAPV
jgi:glutamine amidotransferase